MDSLKTEKQTINALKERQEELHLCEMQICMQKKLLEQHHKESKTLLTSHLPEKTLKDIKTYILLKEQEAKALQKEVKKMMHSKAIVLKNKTTSSIA